ncbi:hypothetical protein OIU77_001764 [Salix suchowensis]|uniref:Uncharacterized protein n=1 Tax=Salix suchowensis TaxID=1278906 RepID=A0ABQ9B2J9_9ROSI|nr:hypothetical protein OIU77_001764 [Salix suchowensis]
MEMTLHQFHSIACCHHENDGIPSHYTISTSTPRNSSAIETFHDMGSLPLVPDSRMRLNICSSVCSYKGRRDFCPRRQMLQQQLGESKICNKGHWRPAEDSKLKELVALHGPQNWNHIAEKLQGRSGKSCRLRWFNQLDPKINSTAFNEDEEERLMAAHRVYGNKWALIARFFTGRTDNAVKNHWHVVMARKYREQSCIYKKRKRTQAVQRRGDNAGDSLIRNTVKNTDPNSNIICSSRIIKPSSLPFSPPIGGSNSAYGKMTAGLLISLEVTMDLLQKRHLVSFQVTRCATKCYEIVTHALFSMPCNNPAAVAFQVSQTPWHRQQLRPRQVNHRHRRCQPQRIQKPAPLRSPLHRHHL